MDAAIIKSLHLPPQHSHSPTPTHTLANDIDDASPGVVLKTRLRRKRFRREFGRQETASTRRRSYVYVLGYF